MPLPGLLQRREREEMPAGWGGLPDTFSMAIALQEEWTHGTLDGRSPASLTHTKLCASSGTFTAVQVPSRGSPTLPHPTKCARNAFSALSTGTWATARVKVQWKAEERVVRELDVTGTAIGSDVWQPYNFQTGNKTHRH